MSTISNGQEQEVEKDFAGFVMNNCYLNYRKYYKDDEEFNKDYDSGEVKMPIKEMAILYERWKAAQQPNKGLTRTELGKKYNKWLSKNNRGEHGNFSGTVFDFLESTGYFSNKNKGLTWVDASESPEVGKNVLVDVNGTILIGVKYNDGWMVFYSDGFFECKNVKHWMPLPEPPNSTNTTPITPIEKEGE